MSFQYPEQESNLQTLGFKPSRSADWRIWAPLKVVPDGIEPSFPVCKTGVVAVGPQDLGLGVEAIEIWAVGRKVCVAEHLNAYGLNSYSLSQHAPKDLNPD